MKLLIDNNAKDSVAEKVRNSKKPVRILKKINKFTKPIFYILAVLHIVLLCAPKEWLCTMGLLHPADMKINLIIRAVGLLLYGDFIHLIINLIVMKFAEQDLLEREKEELTIDQNGILYTFEIPDYTKNTRNQRNHFTNKVVNSIPFRSIAFINYEPKFKKIQFVGQFSSNFWFNPKEDDTSVPSNGNVENITVYDYFTPSLLEQLEQYGITPQ